MNKSTKMIPKLRFPEFKNKEEWDYVSGDKLFEPISNKNHNSDLPILAITQEQGAIPRDLIDYRVSVTDKSIEGYKVVEPGDFIISLRSFQGGIEYSNYLGLCSPAYIVLRKKSDIVNDFYRHYFKSDSFIQDMNRRIEGIRDGKMLSYAQFSEISIPKPSKNEQKKTADCFSSLDEVIVAHTKKFELLKDHKKGLMQNLFPQDGEKVPKYRFPEFKKDGEWEEKKLGDFVTSLDAGVSVNSGDKPAKENEIGILKTSCIREGVFDFSENKVVFKEEEIERVRESVKKDTILVSRMNTPALVGANAYVEKDYPNIFLPDRLWAAKSNKIGSMKFISYILNSDKGRYMLSELATGTSNSMKNITKGDVLDLSIIVPSLSEQLKIASGLSSLDALIAAQAKKIEQLKLHKKGLMQGLSPKMTE